MLHFKTENSIVSRSPDMKNGHRKKNFPSHRTRKIKLDPLFPLKIIKRSEIKFFIIPNPLKYERP